jgi:DNA-binding MarR family transcriptional regulator
MVGCTNQYGYSCRVPPPLTVDLIEQSLVSILRNSTTLRLHERIRGEVGLPLERTAYVILRYLSDGPTRLSDLAGGLMVDTSTASRQVRTLEDFGYLVRKSDPSDGRASMLELTDAGADALERARAAWQRAVESILRDWSEADRATLAPLLARLADGLERYAEG